MWLDRRDECWFLASLYVCWNTFYVLFLYSLEGCSLSCDVCESVKKTVCAQTVLLEETNGEIHTCPLIMHFAMYMCCFFSTRRGWKHVAPFIFHIFSICWEDQKILCMRKKCYCQERVAISDPWSMVVWYNYVNVVNSTPKMLLRSANNRRPKFWLI